MKNIVITMGLGLVALAVALPAHAGVAGPTPTSTINKQSRKDNKVFVGVNWNFGVRTGVTGVVGYRFAKVSTSDRVRGGLVDLTVPFTGAPIGLGEVHLKALSGTRSVQGELGVGYGFQGQAFLVNGAVRVPYATVGTDYLFGKGWQPYIGVHSLGRAPSHRETGSTSCPAGFDLVNGACQSTDDS